MKPKISDYIPFHDVPPVIKELTGVTRTPAAVTRWAKVGRQNHHGAMIKLKASKRLGRMYTTREWLLKFIEEVA